MLQISEWILSIEREFKSKVDEIANVMTRFSNEIESFFYQFPENFLNLDITSKKVKSLEQEELNPFFSNSSNKLPFPLKYVTKPLKKPDIVDFGDGKVFYVSGGEATKSKYVFDLPDHKGFKICKTIGMSLFERLQPFKPMQDFFDIETLQEELKDPSNDEQDQELICSQIAVLHTEYRKLQLNALGIKTDLAISTSKTGEWQIQVDTPHLPLTLENLKSEEMDQIASDIRKYFYLEKLYGINLLGKLPLFIDEAIFHIISGRAVINESVELISFLCEEIKSRHEGFKKFMEASCPKVLTDKIFQDDQADVELESLNSISNKLLENQLLVLVVKRKLGMKMSETAVAEAIHAHIKVS